MVPSTIRVPDPYINGICIFLRYPEKESQAEIIISPGCFCPVTEGHQVRDVFITGRYRLCSCIMGKTEQQ